MPEDSSRSGHNLILLQQGERKPNKARVSQGSCCRYNVIHAAHRHKVTHAAHRHRHSLLPVSLALLFSCSRSLLSFMRRERTRRLGYEPMEDTCLVCMKSPDQSTGLKGKKLIGICGLYQNCGFWLSMQKPNKLAHPLMATHVRLSSLS